ncbi:alpha-L-fucosidase [Pseudarthrobacter equi]|jgi:alpha-L-fucosidase|uniref:alpha-L-fucosidase n=1 Tax=Pseudarthrobacter equi TaxID=728066 RepID=A0A1H1TLC8_9MICC|nr:alpha-L-fucosidase [Pseudarthrobacter equi]SDS60359.1 alpha-L-fucosidase [Pseudarthrobacter equi]
MTPSTTVALPVWAQEASLGIFIHWGPYSVPAWAEPTGAWGAIPPETWFAHNAYAEWYANTIRIEGSPAAEHHKATFGDVPYETFLDQWRAEKYDPASWAALFQSICADYVIPVTKHHDGITLWEAPGTADLNTVVRGPRQDLLAPLAEAVRAVGIRFGVYYSGGLDWAFTSYPPITSMEEVDLFRPTDAAYAEYATAHVRDLIDRFKPSVIWNDIDWPDAGRADGSLTELLEHYRQLVPDGIVNDRWGADVWDYRTSEYSHDTHNESGIGWEHNRGLGFSFGYNQIENLELTMSTQEIAKLYADVVSRGGRLLLNVGPTAAGEIPDVQLRSLTGLAPWIQNVKPYTIQRRPAQPSDDIKITGDGWSRAWVSGKNLVVIADDFEKVRIDAGALEVVAISLPVQDGTD